MPATIFHARHEPALGALAADPPVKEAFSRAQWPAQPRALHVRGEQGHHSLSPIREGAASRRTRPRIWLPRSKSGADIGRGDALRSIEAKVAAGHMLSADELQLMKAAAADAAPIVDAAPTPAKPAFAPPFVTPSVPIRDGPPASLLAPPAPLKALRPKVPIMKAPIAAEAEAAVLPPLKMTSSRSVPAMRVRHLRYFGHEAPKSVSTQGQAGFFVNQRMRAGVAGAFAPLL